MQKPRRLGEELFAQHLRQIETIVRKLAAHHGLNADDSQELYSLVMLKMIRDDYAVLRGFRGESRWGTYLTVIVQRVLLDDRQKKWGRWRPCARSRRLGPTAVQLDQRINRDGLDRATAVRELAACGVGESVGELERLAAQIPQRPRRRFLSGDAFLQPLASSERADSRIQTGERRRTATVLRRVLALAVNDLPGTERELLGLRFGRGWTVRRIAKRLNLKERPLYRRFERILGRLRHRLERTGLCWEEIDMALDGHEVDLEIDLL
ncbi:MAG: sigma-70 family RNA polymerase sigma factor [bacterium]|nr:sigma-70 family RNA polymerase sigma factor [bacterium]